MLAGLRFYGNVQQTTLLGRRLPMEEKATINNIRPTRTGYYRCKMTRFQLAQIQMKIFIAIVYKLPLDQIVLHVLYVANCL